MFRLPRSWLLLATCLAVPAWGCESAPETKESGGADEEAVSSKSERARKSLRGGVEDLEALLEEELVSEDRRKTFKQALKVRSQRVSDLKERFESVITEYKHEPTATAALYHLGRMYLDLGCEIAMHPAPRKLATCQHCRYRETLSRTATKYLGDAETVLRRAVEVGAGDEAESAGALLELVDVPEGRLDAFSAWRTCQRTQSAWTPASADPAILDLAEIRVGETSVEFRAEGGAVQEESERPWRETAIDDLQADIGSTRAAGADAYFVELAPTLSYNRLAELLSRNNKAFGGRLLLLEIGERAPILVASPELPGPDAARTVPGSTAGHVNIGLERKYATVGSGLWKQTGGGEKPGNLEKKAPHTGADPLTLAREARNAEPESDAAARHLEELRGAWDWNWLRSQLESQWPPREDVEGAFTLGVSLHPEFPVDLLWSLHQLDCGGGTPGGPGSGRESRRRGPEESSSSEARTAQSGQQQCRARCKHLVVLSSHADKYFRDEDS